MQLSAEDRRLHPRRAVRHPVTLRLIGGDSIPCESLDVSVGGMKVRSTSRIPVGPADVVVFPDGEDTLTLHGDVVEEIIDASTGDSTARIVFREAPAAAVERVVALPDLAVLATRRRRTRLVALGASIVVAIVVAGVVYVATRGDDEADTPLAGLSQAVSTERSPIDAPPHVTPSPAGPTATMPPSVTASPSRTNATQAPAPSATATPTSTSPPAAPAARVERTDDLTHVVLGETAEETSVRTTSRPSPDGDYVRMQLTVTPEPDGTTLPVSVRIENRSDETLTFRDGLRATVTATRQGASDAVATLASSATQLAPGESLTVDGFLDFGATGEYDVSATTTID